MGQQTDAARPATSLSVCLFCGSSNAVDPRFLQSAAEFGQILAREKVQLVYGGGGIGLMGAAAKAAHASGGAVLGVMPEFLRRQELLYEEVETLMTPNMHDRKRVMFEQSDAFAIFPGGIGTLEEVVELISWRRLDLHRKPIVFLDLDNFWTPFFGLIDHTIAVGMTPAWLPSTWGIAQRTCDVLPIIRTMLAGEHSEGCSKRIITIA